MTFMTLFLKFSRSSLLAMLAELSSRSRKYLSVNSDTSFLYLIRRQHNSFHFLVWIASVLFIWIWMLLLLGRPLATLPSPWNWEYLMVVDHSEPLELTQIERASIAHNAVRNVLISLYHQSDNQKDLVIISAEGVSHRSRAANSFLCSLAFHIPTKLISSIELCP